MLFAKVASLWNISQTKQIILHHTDKIVVSLLLLRFFAGHRYPELRTNIIFKVVE